MCTAKCQLRYTVLYFIAIIVTIYIVLQYVTGFGKTVHVRTRIEIHFIAYYNSHTQTLSRYIQYSNKIAIDKKVCFCRRLFYDPIKPCRSNADSVRPLRALMGGLCSTRCLLGLWYGQGCCGHLSGLLCA